MIGGAKWELTNNWNCRNNSIGSQSAAAWDGSDDTVDRRKNCAQRCLEVESCVAFNYPNPGGKKNCNWKHTYQKSTKPHKECGKANANWQYYTLLEKLPASKKDGWLISGYESEFQ